jgi:hypothetical protein
MRQAFPQRPPRITPTLASGRTHRRSVGGERRVTSRLTISPRSAFFFVAQSTAMQVTHNLDSQRGQYNLTDPCLPPWVGRTWVWFRQGEDSTSWTGGWRRARSHHLASAGLPAVCIPDVAFGATSRRMCSFSTPSHGGRERISPVARPPSGTGNSRGRTQAKARTVVPGGPDCRR